MAFNNSKNVVTFVIFILKFSLKFIIKSHRPKEVISAVLKKDVQKLKSLLEIISYDDMQVLIDVFGLPVFLNFRTQ